MLRPHFSPLALLAVLLLTANAGGCQRAAPRVAAAEAPAVSVSKPVRRDITDYVDFTGRTEAVQAVDIRARVTGYLVSMPFKEGAEVKGPESPWRLREPQAGKRRAAVVAADVRARPLFGVFLAPVFFCVIQGLGKPRVNVQDDGSFERVCRKES
jgi:hypothetical protein